ncbi:DUF4003 family protein [Paenibacillus bovis]|uniref:DUF4003 domain-containing protein n=1 Tax=Paenibacillus bovis TaxID=1616788 RepID=A0A172ZG84_9BACL|nr:DUF4003 family protein [Paenibacillus bovis]ANF96646.1 hypothetical protein AR543_11930 [Paenibacillus bovis]
MNAQDQITLELLTVNMQNIKKEFPWQNVNVSRLAALLYALEGKEAPAKAIRQSYNMLKENTNRFSMFRNLAAIAISSMLSLCEDQEMQLKHTLSIYEQLKQNGFKASEYLVIAAYEIAANTTPNQHIHTMERMKDFYEGMKQHHRFLTNRDDYIFAAMLGLSDIDPAIGVERMEQLHQWLKPEFRNSNGLQSLTQVLVLGGESRDTLDRLLLLRESLKDRDLRMDKQYTLSSLGVLALLPVDTQVVVNDIAEIYAYLHNQKGFNRWSLNKEQRLLYTAALVASRYINEARQDVLTSNLTTNITNIIIAQQTAMIVAITAGAASSAAASG